MADSPSDAAEQARLRRERRQAKIKAGGSARLNKITGTDGRVPASDIDFTQPAANETPDASTTEAAAATSPSSRQGSGGGGDDPEEVDISEHYYSPVSGAKRQPTPREAAMADAQLRQMMLGFERGNTPGQSSPGTPGGAGPDGLDGEDPLMKMMQQMMGGGAGGGPGGAGFPPGGFPQMPGFPQQQQQQTAALDPYTSLWRLLHALVALGLGLYIAVLTPFTGTKIERERAAMAMVDDPLAADDNEHRKDLFFWTFATAEVLLLTTRFYLDKGRQGGSGGGGVVGMVVGYLPEPIQGYVRIVLRYAKIFSTVRADILACIFVLGICSWWRT